MGRPPGNPHERRHPHRLTRGRRPPVCEWGCRTGGCFSRVTTQPPALTTQPSLSPSQNEHPPPEAPTPPEVAAPAFCDHPPAPPTRRSQGHRVGPPRRLLRRRRGSAG